MPIVCAGAFHTMELEYLELVCEAASGRTPWCCPVLWQLLQIISGPDYAGRKL